MGAGAANSSGPASSSITLPGTEDQRAFDLLGEKFPSANADGATARVVMRAPDGEKISNAEHKAALEATLTEVKESSSIGQVTDPFATQAVSTDGTTAYAQVTYTANDTDRRRSHRS
ncbi:hypothetical protein GCM10010207_79180 [Streptomyces atratus]|uniref:MMPL family transporter n=1 Tax=Streptomyces atratus TaxID=1893 RepID=UPI0019CAF3EA|nr:hypothetical protein GCM10010207_79180 [Streptomyces atratus]